MFLSNKLSELKNTQKQLTNKINELNILQQKHTILEEDHYTMNLTKSDKIKTLTNQITDLNINIQSKRAEIQRFKQKLITEESINLSTSDILSKKNLKLENTLQLLKQKQEQLIILKKQHILLGQHSTNSIKSLANSNNILIDYLQDILNSSLEGIDLYENQNSQNNKNILQLYSFLNNTHYTLHATWELESVGVFKTKASHQRISNSFTKFTNQALVDLSSSIGFFKVYHLDKLYTISDDIGHVKCEKGDYIIYENKLTPVITTDDNLNLLKKIDNIKNKYDTILREIHLTYKNLLDELDEDNGDLNKLEKIHSKFSKKNDKILEKYETSLTKINTILQQMKDKYTKIFKEKTKTINILRQTISDNTQNIKNLNVKVKQNWKKYIDEEEARNNENKAHLTTIATNKATTTEYNTRTEFFKTHETQFYNNNTAVGSHILNLLELSHYTIDEINIFKYKFNDNNTLKKLNITKDVVGKDYLNNGQYEALKKYNLDFIHLPKTEGIRNKLKYMIFDYLIPENRRYITSPQSDPFLLFKKLTENEALYLFYYIYYLSFVSQFEYIYAIFNFCLNNTAIISPFAENKYDTDDILEVDDHITNYINILLNKPGETDIVNVINMHLSFLKYYPEFKFAEFYKNINLFENSNNPQIKAIYTSINNLFTTFNNIEDDKILLHRVKFKNYQKKLNKTVLDITNKTNGYYKKYKYLYIHFYNIDTNIKNIYPPLLPIIDSVNIGSLINEYDKIKNTTASSGDIVSFYNSYLVYMGMFITLYKQFLNDKFILNKLIQYIDTQTTETKKTMILNITNSPTLAKEIYYKIGKPDNNESDWKNYINEKALEKLY